MRCYFILRKKQFFWQRTNKSETRADTTHNFIDFILSRAKTATLFKEIHAKREREGWRKNKMASNSKDDEIETYDLRNESQTTESPKYY